MGRVVVQGQTAAAMTDQHESDWIGGLQTVSYLEALGHEQNRETSYPGWGVIGRGPQVPKHSFSASSSYTDSGVFQAAAPRRTSRFDPGYEAPSPLSVLPPPRERMTSENRFV